jgi:hypothetical protein
LARNLSIFKKKNLVLEIITTQGLSILSYFPLEKGSGHPRIIQEFVVDHSNPWAYFDGASQQNNLICAGGELFSSSRKIIASN